jgi:sec-independent protein translocase protein TatA
MAVLAGGPFGLGAPELLIILAVVVIIFGGTKLADLGGSLGKGIKEFKANVKDDDEPAKPTVTPTPVVVQSTVQATPAPTEAQSAVAGSVGVTQAVVCPNCSSLNPMGSKHCNQCGANFAAPVR